MDDQDRDSLNELAKEYAQLRLDFDTYSKARDAKVDAWWNEQWRRNESCEERMDREMELLRKTVDEETDRRRVGLDLVQGGLKENGKEIKDLRAQQLKMVGGLGAVLIILQVLALIVALRG